MKSPMQLLKAMAAGTMMLMGAEALAARFEVINIDPPGAGFNDPTLAAPVGGNAGTTIGAQRLVAYQRALNLWGSVLKSNVTVYVVGSFSAFPPELCAGNVLAQAGALQIFSNFPNAPKADTWYGVALANALAGEDLTPGQLGPEDEYAGADIIAFFNGGIGAPDCIPGASWYYGLDNNAPDGTVDFLNTFMHEVGHGLGFGNFISESDGLPPAFPDVPYPDIYMRNTLDTDLGKTWDQLTPEQIVASATNSGKVVWAGTRVMSGAPNVLERAPFTGLRISLPTTIARELEPGSAAFGPAPTAANFRGQVALAVDAGGASPNDGCEAINPTVSGKIALINRGTCSFLQKVQNAQAAGARAVLIANNTTGVFTMSGTDPNVTIPSLMISQSDGALIAANLVTTRLAVFTDRNRLTGANARNQVRMYAPGFIEPGSSISHFDTLAEPSVLMEPAITPALKAATNVDLTAQLFRDIGWPIESLKIGRCDTYVPNVTPAGDIVSTQVEQCAADSSTRSEFSNCVNQVAQGLLAQRYIQSRDAARMTACAGAVRF